MCKYAHTRTHRQCTCILYECCAAMGRATTSAHSQVRQTNRCVDPEKELTNSNCQRAWKPERERQRAQRVRVVCGWAGSERICGTQVQASATRERERVCVFVCLFLWVERKSTCKRICGTQFQVSVAWQRHAHLLSFALSIDQLFFCFSFFLFILVIYYSFMKFSVMNLGAAC